MSRVCHRCKTRWPNSDDYRRCPECECATTISPLVGIGEKWARSRKNHADFERWLDEHDRRDPVDELERIPVQERGGVRLVRIQAHAYGPRCFVLGRRVHHFHWGLALIGVGVRLLWKDRADIPRLR